MLKKKVAAIAIKGFALLAVIGTPHHAMAQDATTPYPKMAPIDRYLMADQDAEISIRVFHFPSSIRPGPSFPASSCRPVAANAPEPSNSR